MPRVIGSFLFLFVLISLSLHAGGAREGEAKKTKGSEAKAVLKKLEGIWRMVKMEVDGRVKGNADSFSILFDGDAYYFLIDGQKDPNSAKVFLDPTKDPMTIDLVLKGVGVAGTHLGIFRFTENGLEICMNQPRGAGSDKRPHAFTTKAKIGAGSILFVLERPMEARPETEKNKDKKEVTTAKSKKEAIKADLKKLSGNWKMLKLEIEGEARGDTDRMGVLFDGDTYNAVVDGIKTQVSAKIFLDPTKEPKTIDFVLAGGGVEGTKLGIYRFTADGLEICMNPPRGAGSDRRPTAFTTKAKIGAGSVLYILEQPEK